MTLNHPLQSYYSRIHKTYDLVNRLFTFGLDRKWRRHTVEACLETHPRRILDLCCGTGDLAIGISKASAQPVKITGLDLNPQMLEVARQKAMHFALATVEFMQGDAAAMPFADGEFDCITIGFGFRNLTYENPKR
ncbi:MAG: class I SAM-dependent methyltransferase, partial [Bacteroidales bacterium]|nr:class I SAM-dependent methyltransferase [Bacteroidales bacterium]